MQCIVEPHTVTTQNTITKIGLAVREFDFFTSVTMAVYYYNTDGMLFIDTSLPQEVTLTRDEYADWGTDDDYVINLVLTKIGLTRVVPN